ncbi:MAG: flagellar hook-basal body protein [Desulfobacteraceae bacterium]|nr:flagellar hook-basal body protein [Desulfobacteraceae bacterium]
MKIADRAAALGSIEQQKRLDVIANNIANVNTPGYKKDEVHFADFIDQTTRTIWNQGSIQNTGQPLDIALVGEGFLKVQTPDGILYSRAGNLKLDKENKLVNQDGYPVLGKAGVIKANDRNVRIEQDGQVFDGEQSVATLDLVAFPQGTVLNKVHGSYVKPKNEEDAPSPAKNCTVQQSSLESANFSLVEEMARMVDTMRVFEAYQKVLQISAQELDSQVINKLGSL